MSDPIRAALDKAAEALWLAESLRAAGRPRLTDWHDESADTRQKWRFMAAHGNAAFLRALPDDADLVLPSLGPIGRAFPVATLADLVDAVEKDCQP
jgi:hypothetical protein